MFFKDDHLDQRNNLKKIVGIAEFRNFLHVFALFSEKVSSYMFAKVLNASLECDNLGVMYLDIGKIFRKTDISYVCVSEGKKC